MLGICRPQNAPRPVDVQSVHARVVVLLLLEADKLLQKAISVRILRVQKLSQMLAVKVLDVACYTLPIQVMRVDKYSSDFACARGQKY